MTDFILRPGSHDVLVNISIHLEFKALVDFSASCKLFQGIVHESPVLLLRLFMWLTGCTEYLDCRGQSPAARLARVIELEERIHSFQPRGVRHFKLPHSSNTHVHDYQRGTLLFHWIEEDSGQRWDRWDLVDISNTASGGTYDALKSSEEHPIRGHSYDDCSVSLEHGVVLRWSWEKLRELPADPESSDEPELSDASDGSELSDGPNRRLHLEVMRPVHKESSTREHAYRFGSLMELEAHPSACMPEILLDFDHLCSDPSIYILDSNRIMISDVELRDFGRTEYEGDGVPTLYIIDWQKGTIQAAYDIEQSPDGAFDGSWRSPLLMVFSDLVYLEMPRSTNESLPVHQKALRFYPPLESRSLMGNVLCVNSLPHALLQQHQIDIESPAEACEYATRWSEYDSVGCNWLERWMHSYLKKTEIKDLPNLGVTQWRRSLDGVSYKPVTNSSTSYPSDSTTWNLERTKNFDLPFLTECLDEPLDIQLQDHSWRKWKWDRLFEPRSCGALLLPRSSDQREDTSHIVISETQSTSDYISIDSVTLQKLAKGDREWFGDDELFNKIRMTSQGWHLQIEDYGADAKPKGIYVDGESLLVVIRRPDNRCQDLLVFDF